MEQKLTKSFLIDCLRTHTIKEISQKINVSTRTVYRWLKKYDLKKDDGMLNKEQEDIFIGTMLGSGYISKDGRYTYKKKKSKETYVTHLFEKLKPFANKIFYDKINKIKSNIKMDRCCFTTKNNCFFKNQRKKWYCNNRKNVPYDIVLNSTVIFYWHCDSANVNKDKKECFLSTSKFSDNEVNRLVVLLNNIGIKCKSRNKRIHISKKSYFDYMEIVNSKKIKINCLKDKFDFNIVNKNRINNSDLENIKKMYYKNGLTQETLAKKFNVSKYIVWKILNEDFIKVPNFGGTANVNVTYKVD